jgi:hypothetical protein
MRLLKTRLFVSLIYLFVWIASPGFNSMKPILACVLKIAHNYFVALVWMQAAAESGGNPSRRYGGARVRFHYGVFVCAFPYAGSRSQWRRLVVYVDPSGAANVISTFNMQDLHTLRLWHFKTQALH